MKKISAFIVAFTMVCIVSGTSYADCQGCCSHHGGVCCIDGVTKCCDGSRLSQTCIDRGCDKCGSAGDSGDGGGGCLVATASCGSDLAE